MFKDKLLKTSGKFFMIDGEDEAGLPMYYILQVAKTKLDAFKEAAKKDELEPKKYGSIVLSGYGEPDANELEALRIKYNLNLNG